MAASSAGCAIPRAIHSFCHSKTPPWPSRGGSPWALRVPAFYRSLSVASSGPQQHIKVEEGIQEFRVPAVRGLNRVSLEVEEKPTFFIPTDTRPLMLRIDDLKIENTDRAAAQFARRKSNERHRPNAAASLST